MSDPNAPTETEHDEPCTEPEVHYGHATFVGVGNDPNAAA